MLDSWQTAMVGYYTGYGEYVHEDCGDGALVTLRAQRLMDVSEGYRSWYDCVSDAVEQLSERLHLDECFGPVSRYSIHEEQSRKYEDERDWLAREGWEEIFERTGTGVEDLVRFVDNLQRTDMDRAEEINMQQLAEAYIDEADIEVEILCEVCGQVIE